MSNLMDWVDSAPPTLKAELERRQTELQLYNDDARYEGMDKMEKEQVQMGSTTPQLFGTLSKFISNPSTVSVETYKRMIDTDETVGSGIDFCNLAMIARFGDYKHPVKAVQDFVRKAIEQMEGSWHENLDEMFSAEWAGFSTTEQIWKYSDDFDDFPAYIPKSLVTYPPLTMVFAVDLHGRILPDGFYQYQRYHNTFLNSYYGRTNSRDIDGFRPDLFASVGDYPYPLRISADLSYFTIKMPKTKIIHLRGSSTGKFGNPYGRSVLRRVYKNWVAKDAFLRMWIIGADRKGTPLLVGYAAPNDTVLQGDENGNGGAQRADLAMAQTMKTIHNSSFIVFPGKKGEVYDIEAIQSQGDMNVFKDGTDSFNRAIMRGLLLPPMVLGGDGGGSYALAQTHDKIFKQVVDGKNKVYKQGIIDQWVAPIVRYNFPENVWKKHGYGEFLLEDYDPEVMQKLSGVYREMTDTGYMSPQSQEDLDTVRQKLDLPKKKVELVLPPTMDEENPGEETDENPLPNL